MSRRGEPAAAAKRVLDPFANPYFELHRLVEGASDADLAVLVDAPKVLTQTNCGWTVYRVAPIVAEMASKEARRRNYLKAQAAKQRRTEAGS